MQLPSSDSSVDRFASNSERDVWERGVQLPPRASRYGAGTVDYGGTESSAGYREHWVSRPTERGGQGPERPPHERREHDRRERYNSAPLDRR